MRVIDLTLELYTGTKALPGFSLYENNPVRIEVIAAKNQAHIEKLRARGATIAEDVQDGYLAMVSRLTTTTHNGTHMDMPAHFKEDGFTVDELPLEKVVREAVLLDLTNKGPRETIGAADLDEAERRAGVNVTSDVIPVIRTDWTDKMYGRPGFYEDAPYFTPDAGLWFLDRHVSAVACDCYNDLKPFEPHPELRPGDDPSPNHARLLGNDMVFIELVTNLSQIRQPRFLLVALPLKLHKTDGSPARVIAIEEL